MERVIISFPEPMDNLKGVWKGENPGVFQILFEVRYFKAEKIRIGRMKYRSGDKNYIEIDKRPNSPVTCCLMVIRNGKGVLTFKEGGGIFPFDAVVDSEGRIVLRLSWERGPIARVFMEMKLSGAGIERINTPRLYGEIDNLNLKDPWSLDWGYVKYRLATGSFRKTYLRLLDSYSFSLESFINEIGGEEIFKGRKWYFNSPFSRVVVTNEGGSTILSLVPGFYTLFSMDMRGLECVYLSVDNGGNLEIFSEIR